jgi:large subunit ribosomal protein L3
MAGQHGNARTTTLNLEVVEGDAERGLLLVKGAVPGPNGGLVFVRNAAKGPAVAAPDLSAGADAGAEEPAAETVSVGAGESEGGEE